MLLSLMTVQLVFSSFHCVVQLKKKSLKDEEKMKSYEVKKAKDDAISKKRQREERRDKYREQEKVTGSREDSFFLNSY